MHQRISVYRYLFVLHLLPQFTPTAFMTFAPQRGHIHSMNVLFPELSFIPFFISPLHFGHISIQFTLCKLLS